MVKNFTAELLEQIKDEDTTIAADGEGASEFTGFIDTGSFILNAVLSGSIYGGVPNNKVTAFAGEEATGKTFFALGVVKAFLENDPKAVVVYYDTEAAVTKQMMEQRGVDTSRVIVSEPDTIQKFRHHVLKTIDAYETTEEDKRPPLMMVLDSLGQLSTSKEVEDSTEGKDTRDMTRAQVIRGTFRTITLKLARAKVPLIVTNHTYAVVGSYVPMKDMGGGGGLKFAASTIAYLGKKKERDGDVIVGNIITVKMYKSRLSKENQKAEVLLTYNKGLDRYYGLLELGEKHGVVKKLSKQYEFPDGRKAFESKIYDKPEEWFTKDILDKLDECAKKEYLYGQI